MNRKLEFTIAVTVCRISLGVFACLLGGCGSGGTYSRLTSGSGGGFGSGGNSVGSGGDGFGGTDGMLEGSGGSGSGGLIGSGGIGGTGTGDMAIGGGAGTGGVGTAGMGRGGTGTGGVGTGGVGTGVMGVGGAVGPRILSIDFVGGVPDAAGGVGGTTLTPIPMAATEMAGVKMAANWNSASSFMGSLTALKLSDGTVTAAGVTWNSPPVTGSAGIYAVDLEDAPGNARMMNGYLDPTAIATPAAIVVSGLPTTITSGGYDVYVYTLGHLASGTRTYNYTIGTTTFIVSQTGPSPTTVPAFVLAPNMNPGVGNYVIFRNITGASFTLTATPDTGTPRAPVNGIQIVSPTGS